MWAVARGVVLGGLKFKGVLCNLHHQKVAEILNCNLFTIF